MLFRSAGLGPRRRCGEPRDRPDRLPAAGSVGLAEQQLLPTVPLPGIVGVEERDPTGLRRRVADGRRKSAWRRGVPDDPPDTPLVVAQTVVRQKLGAAGIDGFVLMRLIGQKQQTTYVPGTWSPSPWGYWRAAYSPGYLRTDTLVSIETLVYSLRRDGVLWGGLSETINPNRIDSFVTEVADAAVAEKIGRAHV